MPSQCLAADARRAANQLQVDLELARLCIVALWTVPSGDEANCRRARHRGSARSHPGRPTMIPVICSSLPARSHQEDVPARASLTRLARMPFKMAAPVEDQARALVPLKPKEFDMTRETGPPSVR